MAIYDRLPVVHPAATALRLFKTSAMCDVEPIDAASPMNEVAVAAHRGMEPERDHFYNVDAAFYACADTHLCG